MNLLAHAYLSFDQPPVLVGNMISDYVKGKRRFDYPEDIQLGIMLHRAIDDFTDQHPVTKQAKQFFRPHYRLYAGAFIDVVYDHFLANDPEAFSSETDLQLFAQATYRSLEQNKQHLPDKFLQMLPYMQSQNWLYYYKDRQGMKNSFAGLVRRSAYLNDSVPAFAIFETHYDELKEYYKSFFPSLKNFARQWLTTNGPQVTSL